MNFKNDQKVFTKKKRNNIIKKDYDPFTVNNKKCLQRKGLNMKKENINLQKKMKNFNLKDFTNNRIMKNANLFSDKEIEIIRNNSSLVEKIYILGILDNI